MRMRQHYTAMLKLEGYFDIMLEHIRRLLIFKNKRITTTLCIYLPGFATAAYKCWPSDGWSYPYRWCIIKSSNSVPVDAQVYTVLSHYNAAHILPIHHAPHSLPMGSAIACHSWVKTITYPTFLVAVIFWVSFVIGLCYNDTQLDFKLNNLI